MKNKNPIGFFLLCALVLSLPVLIFFFSRIPGEYADTYQVWGKTLEFRNLVEARGVLGTLKWQIENARFTPIETIGWVQQLTNPKVGYNLAWLFSFVMAALGMYLLVHYLTKSHKAGIIAGLIFSFSPFHFSQAVSTNIGTMHYEWIPFFVLFWIKFLRNLRILDGIWAVWFLVLIALTENQLLAFTLPFAALLTLAYLIKNVKTLARPRFWIMGAAGALLLFLAIKILFAGLFSVADSQENYLDPGSDQVRRYSTDAVEFLTPSALHPFWGEKFNYLREDTEANSMGRQSNYIGYGVILLALISLLGLRRRPLIKFFFLGSSVLFLALSLGPYLHWKGEVNENLWMPYAFLYKHVPYWYIIRTVNRIFVMALLALSVSAGFGMAFLLKLLGREREGQPAAVEGAGKDKEAIIERRRRIRPRQESLLGAGGGRSWVFGIFVLVILVEYLVWPVPTMSLQYSKFYDNLAQEDGDFTVVDLPGATSYDYASKLMFYNQIHGRKNWAGMDFARVEDDKWDFERNTPILNDLLYSLPTGGTPPSKEIINDYYYNLATKIFNFYQIKYIIVSKDYLDQDKKFNGPAFENTLNFIDGQFDADQVYEDDQLVAFRVNKSDHINGWFLAMDLRGDYWGTKKGSSGSVMRWARDGAKMRLVNMGDKEKTVRLMFDISITNLRKVEVELNGEKQGGFTTKEEKESHSIILKNVKPGENEIVFRIFDLDGEPVETYELKRGVKFSDLRTAEAEAWGVEVAE